MECKLCKRPMILYSYSKEKNKFILSHGPKKKANNKNWCMGRCYGILADIWLMTSEMLDYIPRRDKKFRKWVIDYMRVIEKDFNKLIEELVQA
jgi:hypothetical protein